MSAEMTRMPSVQATTSLSDQRNCLGADELDERPGAVVADARVARPVECQHASPQRHGMQLSDVCLAVEVDVQDLDSAVAAHAQQRRFRREPQHVDLRRVGERRESRHARRRVGALLADAGHVER